MDFGLSGVRQGYAAIERTAVDREAYENVSKIAMYRPTMGTRAMNMGNTIKAKSKAFGTKVANKYQGATTKQRYVAAGSIGGGMGLVGGIGAIHNQKRQQVMKRSRDPEVKRQRRLENYQTGLVGGGLVAGTAGLTSYAGKAREGVLDAKDYSRNITAQRQKQAAPGAKVGVAGPMDVPVKHYARAFKPGKAQAAATLGGLGAVLAGDQIGRYRRNTGRPYNSLR